jgi:hypothetical protein
MRTPIVPLLLAILLAAGCGPSKNPIAGTVTYRDKPLAEAFITFFPTDGVGTSRGALITEGRYVLEDVPPGPYRVLVSSYPKVDVAGKVKLLPTIEIPAAATNNNAVHEIRPQQKTLDLAIGRK